jgi:hypothetical protein
LKKKLDNQIAIVILHTRSSNKRKVHIMKIKYSALVSDVRGKLNGSVASKNRYGAYLRNKVTPVNRKTTLQQNVRASLSSISKAWRTLTEAQRQSFNSLAAEVNKTNIFGDKVTLSGAALFMRLNRNIAVVGGTAISTAPAIPTLPSMNFLVLTAKVAAGLISLAGQFDGPDTGMTFVIRATPQVSAGINFVKSEFRQLTTSEVGDGFPIVLTNDYASRFGAPILGKKIFVELFAVHSTTGFASQPVQCQTIVVAS